MKNNQEHLSRISDLIAEMTPEEKIAQLRCLYPMDLLNEKWEFCAEKADCLLQDGLGEFAGIFPNMSPEKVNDNLKKIHNYINKHSRLKIPVMIHGECLHGMMVSGSTVFPEAIALGATFDPELIGRVSLAIGKEAEELGFHHMLSPTMNLTRDARSGRTHESYGEDSLLISKIGCAFITGLQESNIAACAKHFIANFAGEGGRDSNAIHLSERVLRETFFPAFKDAVRRAGVKSVMPAYNLLDGIPCSSSHFLLQKVLREEWGFEGITVSDYGAVVGMHFQHQAVRNVMQAGMDAIIAGMDIECPAYVTKERFSAFEKLPDYMDQYPAVLEAVDLAVSRVLQLKFDLGLFENKLNSTKDLLKKHHCSEHIELSRETAEKSIVLLQNDGILPLKLNSVQKIAVIGPSADAVRVGNYCFEGVDISTPLAGLKKALSSESIELLYSPGCDMLSLDPSEYSEIEKAKNLAANADIALLVMGNNAGWPGWMGRDANEGEGNDRVNLDLPGLQEHLISEIASVNSRVIVVLTGGSAITMEHWKNSVSAIINMWYAGERGGEALANILLGKCNPSGRLPLTFPKKTAQLPLSYNSRPSGRDDDYCDLRGEQEAFCFGHGLSYTHFEYNNLELIPDPEIASLKEDASPLTIQLQLKNVGTMRGEEVVQVYIRKRFCPIVQPRQELAAFTRVLLNPGESKLISIPLSRRVLSYLDEDFKEILHSDCLDIGVGASSKEIRLQTNYSFANECSEPNYQPRIASPLPAQKPV